MSHDDSHAEVRAALDALQSAINKALRYEPEVEILMNSVDVTCIGDATPAYVRHLSLVITKTQVIE